MQFGRYIKQTTFLYTIWGDRARRRKERGAIFRD